VGTYTAGGVTSGFLLDRAEYIAVNIAGSTTTRPTDINSQGVIVRSYGDATGSHAFIWNDGVLVTLRNTLTFYSTGWDPTRRARTDREGNAPRRHPSGQHLYFPMESAR